MVKRDVEKLSVKREISEIDEEIGKIKKKTDELSEQMAKLSAMQINLVSKLTELSVKLENFTERADRMIKLLELASEVENPNEDVVKAIKDGVNAIVNEIRASKYNYVPPSDTTNLVRNALHKNKESFLNL